MTVTAVDLSPTTGSISAEGAMGEYGRVYLTYKLTPDANGKGGLVMGEGRGARDDRRVGDHLGDGRRLGAEEGERAAEAEGDAARPREPLGLLAGRRARARTFACL